MIPFDMYVAPSARAFQNVAKEVLGERSATQK